MAKDKAAQDANWAKKKEKLDKKRESDRGSTRVKEKQSVKASKISLQRLQKGANSVDAKVQWRVQKIVYLARAIASVVILAAYAAAMSFLIQQGDDVAASPAALGLTSAMLVALTVVFFSAAEGSEWRSSLLRAQEQKEAAELIKGSLEKKQTDLQGEQKLKERRMHQQQVYKEQLARRKAEEAATKQQVMELARTLRKRREEREKEEKQDAQRVQDDDNEKDAHGWTERQRVQLRAAVARYPESWGLRKARWEVIASEVAGQSSRVCEETFKRLDDAARAAAADAKTQKLHARGSNDARTLDEDLDWLAGEGEETTIGEAPLSDDSESEEDEEDDGDRGAERAALEMDPEHKGTEIRLEGIKAMGGCASVQVELLHLQLDCFGCRTVTRVYLSAASPEGADAKTWCEGCSGLISVRLRPTLLHSASNRLCYVDCVACTVTDVLPSVMMSVCESCDAQNVHKQEFKRNQVIYGTCFGCHSKYAFGAEAIRIEQVTACEQGQNSQGGSSRKGSDEDDPYAEIAEELRYLRKKAKTDSREQMIQLGRQLPQMGACKHFKKSFKWYRFPCCGRAFPCPQCHIESNCPAAALGAHASRMICGKCSMEQSYSPAKPCEKCNFSMMAAGSKHWDDGAGTRNLAVMSTKDAKKFKGGQKQTTSKFKTASKSAERVGTKAKEKREHEKKFGKGG